MIVQGATIDGGYGAADDGPLLLIAGRCAVAVLTGEAVKGY